MPAPRPSGFVSVSGLVAALLALPLAPSPWHGPEVAAVLACAAIASLAGHRWGVIVVVVAELFLLATIVPRALFEDSAIVQWLSAATLVAIVPGLLALPRCLVALVRRGYGVLAASGLAVALLPLLA